MLLATTSQLTQEVPAVPFLWVLPLSIYLLSFILCFDRPRWYDRRVFGVLLPAAVAGTLWLLHQGLDARLWLQLTIYSLLLFACCMTCHGELVRGKPAPSGLTLFYLALATGGAAGGAFVGLLAPVIFDGYWEFHVALLACCLLALPGWFEGSRNTWLRPVLWLAAPLGLLLLTGFLYVDVRRFDRDVIHAARNFYGVLRVKEEAGARGTIHELYNGRSVHGGQFRDPEKRRWPTAYYGHDSGAGLALNHHPARREGAKPRRAQERSDQQDRARREGAKPRRAQERSDQQDRARREGAKPRRAQERSDQQDRARGLDVGAIGLGTGVIATLARPGDRLRFYEINPLVARLARERFTFLADSPASSVEVVLGDGRLRLEREQRRFDVLVVDAFNSESIPVHLLTAECFEAYWRRLRPDGLLTLLIATRFVDLQPVMRGHARASGKEVIQVVTRGSYLRGTRRSRWVVFGDPNNPFFRNTAVTRRRQPMDARSVLWTDRRASLWPLLRWSRGKPVFGP
jgi:hypothetical protein